jgi:hypothetical protein
MPSRLRFWLLPVLMGAGLLAGLRLFAHEPNASPEHRFALERLEARRQQQEESVRAAKFGAFHRFRFWNRLPESGIGFQHRAVEDAGRTYQAAHYDHGNALAVADIDADGRPDLYFTTQLGTNQLWRNLGGGRFEDATATAGLGLPDQISVGASFADVDNDGDPDLFVTTVRHGNHLFENLGGGRFRDVTAAAGVAYSGHSSGALFFDADNDGRLDLLLTNVGVYTEEARGPGGFYRARADAFQGHLHPARTELHKFYRNLGGLRFEDASKARGFRDGSWAGDAAFADVDRDGFADVYLVNMQGDDRLYLNPGGKRFVERTAAHFPKTPWGAMGVKFFDFDQDGLSDLFVTDMHSDMTQPQTEKALAFGLEVEKAKSEAFCSVQWPESYYQGSANNIFGNAFYRNLGDGRYAEVSQALGVETYWPWGVSTGDLNADGFEDLFVTAGMGYPFRYAINSVLLNEAGTRFFDAEFLVGVEPRPDGRTEKVWFTLDCAGADRGHPGCGGFTGTTNILGTLSSRSSALVDLDGDGDLDLVTNDFNDRPLFLLSDLTERRPVRYLAVTLAGTRSNRDGLGATVVVRAAGKSRYQTSDGKSGYLAQSSMPLYFGLADASEVESVEVRWPSGTRQTVPGPIPANQRLRIEEPARE